MSQRPPWRPRVSLHSVRTLLRVVGVSQDAISSVTATSLPLFAPFFTPSFVIEDRTRLEVCGDAVLQRYVSGAILRYCLEYDVALSARGVYQVEASISNHYTHRHFGERIGLTAAVLSEGLGIGDERPTLADVLHSPQKEPHVGSTGFSVGSLACGHAVTSRKLSLLLGTLGELFGDGEAEAVVHRHWGLDGAPNFPLVAGSILSAAAKEYPPSCVAEAVLHAQGWTVEYSSDSRLIEQDKHVDQSTTAEGGATHETDDRVATLVDGFGQAPQRVNSAGDAAKASIVSGPGGFDASKKWKDRVGQADLSSIGSGWLNEVPRKASPHIPTADTLVKLFADSFSPSVPSTEYVYHRPFSRPVSDAVKNNDASRMKNGIPLDTQGEHVLAHVVALSSQKSRIFKVTMRAVRSGNHPVELGVSMAPTYSEARVALGKGYVGAILGDLLSLPGAADVVGSRVSGKE